MIEGGMNPATATQNRLKPVDRASDNLIYQVLYASGGFESAFACFVFQISQRFLL
jgi:hypothetical protein